MINYEERKQIFLTNLKENFKYNLHENKNEIVKILEENLEDLDKIKDKELANFYEKLKDEVIKIF